MLSLESLKKIKCPNCKSLGALSEDLKCGSCETQFPTLQGIPWLIAPVEESLLYWQDNSRRLYDYFVLRTKDCEQKLGESLCSGKTKSRLEQLQKAYSAAATEIQHLLPEFFDESHQTSPSFQFKNQKLESYYFNIFRDWAWDTDENHQHISPLLEMLNDTDLGEVLVLGSGTSRFAIDLQAGVSMDKMYLLDINPLLLTIAKKLILDKLEIEMHEMAFSPASLGQSSKKWTLKSNVENKTPVEFLFSDAMNIGFNSASLDTVLTPWFLDIIPQAPSEYIKRINCALKKEGRWLYFGPAVFNRPRLQEQLSLEELLQLAESHGFKILQRKTLELPYLQSPLSGQKRFEHMAYFVAEKANNAKEPPEFHSRPLWLRDYAQPIDKSHWLMQKMVESKIYFEVLSAIDGQRSMNELIQLVSRHYGMSLDMAKQSLTKYFMTLLEEQE